MSQGLLEALPHPALIIAPDGRVSHMNRGAKDILGEAVAGRHYITALRQPGVLDAIERARATRKPTNARYLTSEANNDVTLLAQCALIEPENSILVVLEDRTALEAAGQIRRDFVANVSHELRTPLTALLGFIETLQGAARNDPDSQDRFLGIMKREAERMNRLVGDLLSLGRVEADERVRPTGMVDLAALGQGALTSLAKVAEDASVTLTGTGLDTPCEVPGDADQISQVLTNLLENAIKYSGPGKNVALALTEDPENRMIRGDAAVISISDTGEGIDPIHIPRLTERFYRIDSHRSREMGGTGLGLAIVKHIVSRHRGRLKIESQLGIGSRFSVILPRRLP